MKHCIALLFLMPLVLHAAAFQKAAFTKIVNDVRMLPESQPSMPAKVGDLVPGQASVTTGHQSRAELKFADSTIARLGADSVFKVVPGTRTVALKQGVMLLQVPKKLGGARIQMAAITAVVTGTTLMVEHQPGGYVKIIVLEGEVDVFRADKPSVFRTLHAGDMLIMRPDGESIPEAVQVDLRRLKQTSKLTDEREFGHLGNERHLSDADAQQDHEKQRGHLAPTLLRLPGRGTVVEIDDGARDRGAVVGLRVPPPAASSDAANEQAASGSSTTGGTDVPATKNGRPPQLGGVAVIDNASSIVTDPSVTAAFNGTLATGQGKIYRPGKEGPLGRALFGVETLRLGDGDFGNVSAIDQRMEAAGEWSGFSFESLHVIGAPHLDAKGGPVNLLLASRSDITLNDVDPFNALNENTGSWDLLSSGLKNIMLAARDNITWSAGFSMFGTNQNIALYTQTGDITFTGAPLIELTAGALDVNAARDLNVWGTSAPLAGPPAQRAVVSTPTLKADTVKLSAERNVTIGRGALIQAQSGISVRAKGSITITDSAQLRYLSTRLPQELSLVAEQGNVNVGTQGGAGATLQGVVTAIESQSGNIGIYNSTITASYLQVHTLAPNGNLTIGGSTLSAASGMKLYAEGSNGTVQFVGNTTLDGPATIAGHTVQVDSGVTVNVKVPNSFNVYSDVEHFNTTGYGNFSRNGTPLNFVPSSSAGPHKDGFSAKPAF